MTKIAIKGPSTGTGNYTLNAPDTNDTLDFELPTTGTHLASAQADGMPLGTGGDPVVESGSNSDGRWTKWADGTQTCDTSGDVVSTAVGNTDAVGNTWTFPLSFSETPRVLPSVRVNDSNDDIKVITYFRSVSNTSARIILAKLQSGGSVQAGAAATGRWK